MPCRSSVWLCATIAAGFLAPMAATWTSAAAAIRFSAPLLTQVGGTTSQYRPARPTVADLDSDGILDVIVSPSFVSDSLAILFGRDDGTLAPPITVCTPQGALHTAVGDFDGDGALDIAYASGSDGLHGGILFGDGTGRNWTYVSIPALAGTDLCAGDFDGDGRCDLALASGRDHAVRALLSRPGRTFQLVTSPADSLDDAVSFGMRVKDLNRDGKPDLVISVDGSTAALLAMIGRGDGTFSVHSIYDLSLGGTRGIDVADVNGDGIPDVVAALRWGVAIFPGAGDGTFGAGQVLSPTTNLTLSVAVGDVTGDGTPDIVCADPVARSLMTWPGLSNGALGTPVMRGMGHGLSPVILADMNRDERLDVVSMEPSDFNQVDAEGIVVGLGNGDGTFGQQFGRALVPQQVLSLSVGDLDGDGRPDLLAITDTGNQSSLRSVLSRSGRSFLTTSAIPLAGSGGLGALADFDEDGHLDGAVLLNWSRIAVLHGNGDGPFAAPTYVLTDSASTWGFSIADVTGEGHLDLVTIAGSHAKIYPGHGDGTFGPPIDSPMASTGMGYGFAPMADLNGDGTLDFVWNVSNAGWKLAKGVGNGMFQPLSISGGPVGDPSVAVGDLNGDGKEDLVVTDNNYAGLLGGVFISRLQLDNGTFGPFVTSHAQLSFIEAGSIADVDGDAIPDLVCRHHGDIAMNRGLGDGHFELENGYGGLGALQCIAAGDFDGDGRLDIAGGYVDSVCFFFGRDPTPPTVSLVAPPAGSVMPVGATVRLRWNAGDNEGVASMDLFVSRHGSSGPFEKIATGVANSSQFDWTITAPYSDSVIFKVIARDLDGNVGRAISAGVSRIVDPAGVGELSVAHPLAIESVRPNPSTGPLSIRFALPRVGRAQLALFDLQGRQVARLLDRVCEAGETTVAWKGATRSRRVQPGVYFARLDFDGRSIAARLAIVN